MVWVIVIVVVLIVAVPVVLAAVLYTMTSGLISGPGPSKPVVAFATPTPLGLGEQLTVASVSQAAGPANYRLNLGVSGVTGAVIGMPPTGGSYVVLAVGSQFYRVNWTDIGGEGTLSGGDSFTVTQTNVVGTTYVPLPIASSFIFYLLWSDGSQISSVSFQAA